jgi:hypothetical protein
VRWVHQGKEKIIMILVTATEMTGLLEEKVVQRNSNNDLFMELPLSACATRRIINATAGHNSNLIIGDGEDRMHHR